MHGQLVQVVDPQEFLTSRRMLARWPVRSLAHSSWKSPFLTIFPLLFTRRGREGEYFKRLSLNAWFQSLSLSLSLSLSFIHDRFIIDAYYISFAGWIVIIRENRKPVGIKKWIHNKTERGKFIRFVGVTGISFKTIESKTEVGKMC